MTDFMFSECMICGWSFLGNTELDSCIVCGAVAGEEFKAEDIDFRDIKRDNKSDEDYKW